MKTLILITGGSKGFGKRIAMALAESSLVTDQPTDMLLIARDIVALEEASIVIQRV